MQIFLFQQCLSMRIVVHYKEWKHKKPTSLEMGILAFSGLFYICYIHNPICY